MKSYESVGRNVEEAINAGLAHLGASISDVDITILSEGSKGLFGLFGSREAKVRLLSPKTKRSAGLCRKRPRIAGKNPNRCRLPNRWKLRFNRILAHRKARRRHSCRKLPA